MRSSKSVKLLLLGSAMTIFGCGGGGPQAAQNCPVGPDGKPIPGPDGKINPNCTKSSSRSRVHTGGVFVGGMGGQSNTTTGVKSGVAAPGTRTSSFGGFGGTGSSSTSSSAAT
jgi:hypothetical protein